MTNPDDDAADYRCRPCPAGTKTAFHPSFFFDFLITFTFCFLDLFDGFALPLVSSLSVFHLFFFCSFLIFYPLSGFVTSSFASFLSPFFFSFLHLVISAIVSSSRQLFISSVRPSHSSVIPFAFPCLCSICFLSPGFEDKDSVKPTLTTRAILGTSQNAKNHLATQCIREKQ